MATGRDDERCTLTSMGLEGSLSVPSLLVSVRPPEGPAIEARLTLQPLVIGTGADCDLVVSDPRISRRHCEIRLTEKGIVLRDLGSKNGTLVGKVALKEALIPPSVPVILGGSELTIRASGAPSVVPMTPAGSFGELPLDLQPKLLRALEAKQVRRVGASAFQPFDARIVAATHRNLRARIAEGSFREDLYYRLAVVEVQVPALRERKEDIPALVEATQELARFPCDAPDCCCPWFGASSEARAAARCSAASSAS